MYFNSAVLYFVWAFLGMVVILLIRSLIMKQKQVPRYTLAEARQHIEKGRSGYITTLIALIIGDSIAWLLFGSYYPLSTSIVVLSVFDLILVLKVLLEMQEVMLAKKRIRQIELHRVDSSQILSDHRD